MGDIGRAPSGQALAVPATPASAVDGPSGFDPSRYTDSTLVPNSIAALLGEIVRIADDYDLRDAIDDCGPTSIADSFIWRDCIEAAAAIATEARRAETVEQGSVHEGAGREAALPNPSQDTPSPPEDM
jgi:hypothetical protein